MSGGARIKLKTDTSFMEYTGHKVTLFKAESFQEVTTLNREFPGNSLFKVVTKNLAKVLLPGTLMALNNLDDITCMIVAEQPMPSQVAKVGVLCVQNTQW